MSITTTIRITIATTTAVATNIVISITVLTFEVFLAQQCPWGSLSLVSHGVCP